MGDEPNADTPLETETPKPKLPEGHNVTDDTLARVDKALVELCASLEDLRLAPKGVISTGLLAPVRAMLEPIRTAQR